MKQITVRRAITIACDETAIYSVPDDYRFDPGDFDDDQSDFEITYIEDGTHWYEMLDSGPWELIS